MQGGIGRPLAALQSHPLPSVLGPAFSAYPGQAAITAAAPIPPPPPTLFFYLAAPPGPPVSLRSRLDRSGTYFLSVGEN